MFPRVELGRLTSNVSQPARTSESMPHISSFYGISILMFLGDHNPPHFHARYAGQAARVALDGSIIDGRLPRRAARLVSEWAALHGDELSICWDRAVNHELPGTIEPLLGVALVDITEVAVVEDRVVRLWFSDGSERVVDLAPLLWGPVFGDIASDDDLFTKVRVDPEVGTITWPNGADLDPDVLHGDHEPANPARPNSETG